MDNENTSTERAGEVTLEPMNPLQAAIDVGLDATASAVRALLGTELDVVILVRLPAGAELEGNDGFDSCIATRFVGEDGGAGDRELVRNMLERALKAEANA